MCKQSKANQGINYPMRRQISGKQGSIMHNGDFRRQHLHSKHPSPNILLHTVFNSWPFSWQSYGHMQYPLGHLGSPVAEFPKSLYCPSLTLWVRNTHSSIHCWIINIVFITNPKLSPILTTVKKINSIAAHTSTPSCNIEKERAEQTGQFSQVIIEFIRALKPLNTSLLYFFVINIMSTYILAELEYKIHYGIQEHG